MPQRGVHAVEGQLDVVAIAGDRAAVTAIGYVVIGSAGCGALIHHAVIHTETVADQRAGAAVAGAAAAIGKAAGGAVAGVGGQIGMPVGHGNRGWVASYIKVDFDGGSGGQLFNAFQTMSVGVACRQADQHLVVEAILAAGATAAPVALWSAHGLLDDHVIEGGGTDCQGIGQGSRPGLDLAIGTDFQGGRGDLVTIAGTAQHDPLKIDGQRSGAGNVAQTAIDGPFVGRQCGSSLAGCW